MKILESSKLKDEIKINDVLNTIVWGDTLQVLRKIPDESINLIITSPSYLIGKEYEIKQTLPDYLNWHEKVIVEIERILKSNGAVYWDVAQTPIDGEIIPLGALFYNLFKKHNFFLKNWIIWHFEGGLNTKKRLSGRYENLLWFVKIVKKAKLDILNRHYSLSKSPSMRQTS